MLMLPSGVAQASNLPLHTLQPKPQRKAAPAPRARGFASSFALLALAVALALPGCSTYQNVVEGQKTAYRKAEKRENGLEVPPDLTAQRADEQFIVPGETGSGAVSASGYFGAMANGGAAAGGVGSAGAQGAKARNAKLEPVLLTSSDIKLKREGNVRSLEVKLPPEELWPKLREFWKDVGFELSTDDAKVGLMETDWLENRASIPMDGVRKVIGSVLDGLYSSNQRDRYRTRVERTPNGGTEVFITHRGMEENYIDQSQTVMKWMNRPNDPELEVEMLNRLASKLTGEKQLLDAKGGVVTQLVTLKQDGKQPSLVLAEDFPMAWRRVGFGLDRAGFVVEDRDRANGVYYVKFTPDSGTPDKAKKGFLSGIFGGGGATRGENLKNDQRLQVLVTAGQDNQTAVRFANERGEPLDPKAADEATKRLAGRLK